MKVIYKKDMLVMLVDAASGPDPDLHALQHVEEVVHACEMMHVLKDGHQQGGGDGEGAGQQHPGETRPAQVQETLRAGKHCDIYTEKCPCLRAFQQINQHPDDCTSLRSHTDVKRHEQPARTAKIQKHYRTDMGESICSEHEGQG